MIANHPKASAWIDIPNSCRMRGEFTSDHDIQVMFGDPDDGVNVLFQRPALERFVRLARELLAVPIPDDPEADLPKLYATDATVRTVVKEAGTVVHLRGRPTEQP
jgi:hypothetical protein